MNYLERRKRILFVIIFLYMGLFLFAQENDDWYYSKPIKNISFVGLVKIKKIDLDGIINPFIGKKFSDNLYGDLLNKITALDYFDSIEPNAFPADEKKEQVVLQFTVVEKPVVAKIHISGNRGIRSNEIKEAIVLKEDKIFNNEQLSNDERSVRNLYLKKGYTNVKVSSLTHSNDKGVEVEFVVDEGSPTVVKSIIFQGNEVVSEKTLKGMLKLKEVSLFNKGAFQESTLETDRQEVLTYYRNRGYIDVAIVDVVRTAVVNEKDNRNELTLAFIIKEGYQYTFSGLTIEGNTIFKTPELMAKVKLAPGAIFNSTKFQEGFLAISDLYYENGYATTSVEQLQSKNTETKQVSSVIRITERSRSHIENIIVQGNKKTKPYVILRELPFETGDIFSKTKMIQGLRNLYNLQFFSGIIPDIVPGSEDNLVNLVVNVEEQSTTSVEFGVTFSGSVDPDDFPVAAFVKWQDTNLAGTGKTISTGLTASPKEQTLSLGFADYWLLGKPISINTNLDVSHSTKNTLQKIYFPSGINSTDYFMSYDQWIVSLSSGVGYRWYPNFAVLNLQGGFASGLSKNIFDNSLYEPVDFTIGEAEKKWALTTGVWTSFSMDNRDLAYDPSKGWFFSERLSWTGLLPGVENQFYMRSDTKLEGYLTLLDIPVTDIWNLKFVLAGYTGLSFLQPGTNEIPIAFSNKLYIDGMFNGRGWSSQYFKRGQALWSNFVELRWPVAPGVFSLDFFTDMIALKPTVGDMFTNLRGEDLYFSFGPGARFSLPQFPLRLLLANTFQVKDGEVKWQNGKGPEWQFVLSFNITNR